MRSLAPTKAGGKRRGGGRHRQAHGRWRKIYTVELATDHEAYSSGHGESPRTLVWRWRQLPSACQGEASVAGFQAMFEGRHPTTGELLGRPHGGNAVPAFDVVLRPTKEDDLILFGLGGPATGRAVLAARHAGLAEAVGYLDGHLGARRGHGGLGQAIVRTGAPRSASTTGPPEKAIRCCTPTWSSPIGYGGRTDAGRPWTAGICIGIGWPPSTISTGTLPTRTRPDTRGRDGQRRTPTATGELRDAEALVRGFSKRTDRIDAAASDQLVADGGERTPRLV